MCRTAEYYNDQFKKIFNNLIKILGSYTVRVLLERVRWENIQKFQETDLIVFKEDEIIFTKLFEKCNKKLAIEIYESFVFELTEILKKLVGLEICNKILHEQ